MSRSGYSDDCDGWALIRWRGAVNAAIRGKRGQAFLQELVTVLDAMPAKRLIAEELVVEGEVCALGSVGQARGLQMQNLDAYDSEGIAELFGIAPAMAKEIMYENDDAWCGAETPEHRWQRVRAWAVSQLPATRTGEGE